MKNLKKVLVILTRNKNPLLVTIDIEDWYHVPSVCGSPFSVYFDTDDFFSSWLKEYDYLTKPIDLDDLILKAKKAENRKREREAQIHDARMKPYISEQERNELISKILEK